MIQELINKFAPMLEKHGVKLSAAEETAKIEMAVEGALADGTAIFSPADEWTEGVEIYVMDADGYLYQLNWSYKEDDELDTLEQYLQWGYKIEEL